MDQWVSLLKCVYAIYGFGTILYLDCNVTEAHLEPQYVTPDFLQQENRKAYDTADSCVKIILCRVILLQQTHGNITLLL